MNLSEKRVAPGYPDEPAGVHRVPKGVASLNAYPNATGNESEEDGARTSSKSQRHSSGLCLRAL